MPHTRRLLLGLFTLALVLACAPTRALSYLSPEQLDLPGLLAAPPAADSAAQLADLAAVLAVQETRSAAAADFARADARVSVFRFADVLGPAFTEQDLPLTAALFRQIGREVATIGGAAKKHWARPRPYVASSQVKPLLQPSSDGAYPSGHAMFGYVSALLLAQLVPEQRDALIARGITYGENRIVAGVHYPTDVAAGRTAATAMAALLLQDTAFRQDLAAVRAEVRATLQLP